jgi:hypothetical protein
VEFLKLKPFLVVWRTLLLLSFLPRISFIFLYFLFITDAGFCSGGSSSCVVNVMSVSTACGGTVLVLHVDISYSLVETANVSCVHFAQI